MKKLTLILACVLICGCDVEYIHGLRNNNAREVTTDLIYVKDYRTDICFAMYQSQMNNGLMTAVPCSADVERLIVK